MDDVCYPLLSLWIYTIQQHQQPEKPSRCHRHEVFHQRSEIQKDTPYSATYSPYDSTYLANMYAQVGKAGPFTIYCSRTTYSYSSNLRTTVPTSVAVKPHPRQYLPQPLIRDITASRNRHKFVIK